MSTHTTRLKTNVWWPPKLWRWGSQRPGMDSLPYQTPAQEIRWFLHVLTSMFVDFSRNTTGIHRPLCMENENLLALFNWIVFACCEIVLRQHAGQRDAGKTLSTRVASAGTNRLRKRTTGNVKIKPVRPRLSIPASMNGLSTSNSPSSAWVVQFFRRPAPPPSSRVVRFCAGWGQCNCILHKLHDCFPARQGNCFQDIGRIWQGCIDALYSSKSAKWKVDTDSTLVECLKHPYIS